MHRKSFLIKDILERQQKTLSNLNEFSSSECVVNNHDSYLCKADTCNVYSSNSAWRFATNNCFSCINSIPANSSNSWPAVLCNSGNEKLVSLQNRCKDALFNSIYYNTQSIGQTFIDNFTAFETASDVLSNSSSLEVTESGNQPLVTCSMPSTTTVSTSSSSSTRKVRRNRTVFTELQLMGLERRFDSQKYLSTPDRAELARALGLTQLQVKTWYQNRRMKWKKQVMQGGCPIPPTKPKGRPKKNSIPSLGMNLENSVGIIGVSHKTSNLQSLLQQNVVHSQPFPR